MDPEKCAAITLKFEQCGCTMVKNPKNMDSEKFAVITLKFEQCGLTIA